MKKIILGILLAGVVIIGVGVYLVFSNLDAIVEQVIETAGTEAVGTKVSVDSVKLELSAGRASIYGFAVANPEGFSNADMISFDELSVVLDLANITKDNIAIVSVVARKPLVLYESRNNISNLDVVNDKLGGSSAPAPESDTASAPIHLSIGKVQIDDIQAVLNSDLLPQTVEMKLGDINLKNMKGTPEEIAKQITRPLINQLANNAGQALLKASAAVLKVEAGKMSADALEKADAAREELEDKLKQNVDDKVGDEVRKGLGNLLKGN